MAAPSPAPFPLTGDTLVDASTHGFYWQLGADRTLRWAISDGFFGETWGASANYFIGQINGVLNTISAYANVNFQFLNYYVNPSVSFAAGADLNVSLDGQLIFTPAPNVGAVGHFPWTGSDTQYAGQAGDVYINLLSSSASLPTYDIGSQGWFLLLHELGHTLGLKHTHDSGGTDRPTLGQIGLPSFDRDWFSVMSYNDDFRDIEDNFDPATPMLLDVLGLQAIYGVNRSTNLGNTTLTLGDFNLYYTLWDAGGIDTLNASGSSQGWQISLPNQILSSLVPEPVGFAIPLAELNLPSPLSFTWLEGYIENVVGSRFGDDIAGNFMPNRITGGRGQDFMSGGGARDIFDFNRVIDTAKARPASDVIFDFRHRVDDIDLRGIDANTHRGGNQNFHLIGSQHFHQKTGEVRIAKVNNPGTANDHTYVMGDVNGDGRPDFQIHLLGLVRLTGVDFIL